MNPKHSVLFFAIRDQMLPETAQSFLQGLREGTRNFEKSPDRGGGLLQLSEPGLEEAGFHEVSLPWQLLITRPRRVRKLLF